MAMKRYLFNPLIVATGGLTPGDNPNPGQGSAQGSPDVDIPYDWEEWAWMFEEDDSDGNGTPGEYTDYVAWMKERGFDDYITEP